MYKRAGIKIDMITPATLPPRDKEVVISGSIRLMVAQSNTTKALSNINFGRSLRLIS